MSPRPTDRPEPAERVFQALGDPSRRALLRLLAEQPDATATELSTEVAMSRQAVSKHLATLRRAGLLQSVRHGREVHHRLDRTALDQATTWIEDIAGRWDRRLDLLHQRFEDDE